MGRIIKCCLILLAANMALISALLFRTCGLVKREYYFEMAKLERNDARRESEICRTKYPVLLVHGIFFGDWQFLNYWGEFPGSLSGTERPSFTESNSPPRLWKRAVESWPTLTTGRTTVL